ncbi:MAG TPA: AAA family ATPase [Candidatus Lachnoclostridium pullistercoris]|uniref:AAA family ATPase n=1 Tax=Candidatus Lachnoclostridium pullistercoris TaxID=2838632 RepID=A0A9D2PD79_9FIRM|nr:AAA family ATPase [Candidatus Lachnoclostridium pullistercoris]
MDATFMTALHICHVRHLKNIDIPLSEEKRKTLILTGKNGSGKTSVLEALETFLEYVVSEEYQTKEQCKASIQLYEKKLNGPKNTEEEKEEAKKAQKLLDFFKRKHLWWTDGAIAEFPSYADLREKYKKGEYILAYYGDNRKIQVQISKDIEKVDLKPMYSIKEHPGQQLVKYLVNLKTTEAFARTGGNQQRADEIKDWFSRFERVLQEIYEDETLTLNFNIETFEFTISQNGREPFSFNAMSMGYAAVFDIVADLMMRMESKRRYDVEGLVLVDEIESHLHVELQKKIVPILMKLFPNIQFLLTTHSPFILNSTPNAVVYDLETGKLVKDGLTKLPYEGIVEGYFGADLLSEELRKKFNEYQKIAEKKELTDEDFARAAELELYLDEVPDYLALDFAAEYGRLKLEMSERG